MLCCVQTYVKCVRSCDFINTEVRNATYNQITEYIVIHDVSDNNEVCVRRHAKIRVATNML